MSAGPVPAEVIDAGQRIEVERAWPGRGKLTFAGSDPRGRVRAGSVDRQGQVKLLAHAVDPKLPGLSELAAHGRLVAHRPGKRAVIAVESGFVKLTRSPVAPVVERAERGERIAAAAGLAAAAVLEHGEDRVRFSVVPGTDAHHLGGVATARSWRSWWGDFGEAWVDFAGAPTDGLPLHDAEAELAVVQRWVDRAIDFGAVDPVLARRGLAALAPVLLAAAGPVGVSHRDLHDKQVMFADAGVGILDFDTLAWGELALDQANLIEHAQLRRRQGRWSPQAAAVVERTGFDLAERLQVPAPRLAAYRWATRLRLGCVYAFRPPWRELAAQLLAEAADEAFLIDTSPNPPADREESVS
ncbi:phosphotransferase [Naumannella halotolerans]|uniref:Aminoglycoside phosphotransferase domain-containing protein n=1 Tax=Naumannella halotolerans TaxID=993414 RepID=A0A4R7J9W8_9ACTN|nr:phosphotransferase [Naumannella halotolerans]TDT34351.1 hypothetical protein CLV29_2011 [Naumannella halotolerans]